MTGQYYLWYVSRGVGQVPVILGVYDRPSEIPDTHSKRIGDGDVASALRDITRFSKRVTDVLESPYTLTHWLGL